MANRRAQIDNVSQNIHTQVISPNPASNSHGGAVQNATTQLDPVPRVRLAPKITPLTEEHPKQVPVDHDYAMNRWLPG